METTLPSWQALLAGYGLCYIIQNKMDSVLNLWWVTAKLAECPLCAGVVSGFAMWALFGFPKGLGVNLLLWPLTIGGFCAIVDPLVRFFEDAFWPPGIGR